MSINLSTKENKTETCFPDVLRIETSGLCNFRCVYCPQHSRNYARGLMTEDTFNLLCRQLAQNNFVPRVVVLYHGGEPLLDQHLEDKIHYFKSIGVEKTVITTNASLLTPKRSKNLLEAGLDEMKCSFDGNSPEENNAQRVNGDFFANASNVLSFLRLKLEGNYQTNVIISNIRLLHKKEWEKLTTRNPMEPSELSVPPGFISDFFQDFSPHIQFHSFTVQNWPKSDLKRNDSYYIHKILTPYRPICSTAIETVTVKYNGDCVPCCYDVMGKVVLGNIKEESIFDIWNNKKSLVFRQRLNSEKPPVFCKECIVFSRELFLLPSHSQEDQDYTSRCTDE